MEVGRDLVGSGGSEGRVEGGQWRRRRWRRRLVRVNCVEMCQVEVGGIDRGTVGLGRCGRLIQRIVEEYRDGNCWRSRSHQVEARLGVTPVTRGKREGGVASMSEVVTDAKPSSRP